MSKILDKHFDFKTKRELREFQADLIRRIKTLGKSKKYLSRVFAKKPQQIYTALKTDEQPTLLIKINKHISLLENKCKG
jgi:plasmid maintenance system killer protein